MIPYGWTAGGQLYDSIEVIAMPIRSKAQRRKFAQLLIDGKITPETYEEWNRAAGKADLPERLHPKAKSKTKRKVKSKRAHKPRTTAAAQKRNRSARKPG